MGNQRSEAPKAIAMECAHRLAKGRRETIITE